MTEFSAILAQLEASTERREGAQSVLVKNVFDGPATDGRDLKTRKSREETATSAYAQFPSDRQSKNAGAQGASGIQSMPLPDPESVLGELRLARGSAEKLRSLRRKLAWICHPDRRRCAPDPRAESLMAELNAQIDAALEQLARAPTRRNASKRRG